MNLIDVDYDGGTKMFEKDNYRILECNILGGNRDVYFNNIIFEYQDSYCRSIDEGEHRCFLFCKSLLLVELKDFILIKKFSML